MTLEEEYVWATEVNIATLQELVMLRGTAKSRIRRQKTICARMLDQCRAIERQDLITPCVDWRYINGRSSRYPRVHSTLQAIRGVQGPTESLLEAHLSEI